MRAAGAAREFDQRYYGVAEALVTDVDDPEKEGRVKVTFPWFDAQMTSDWCRVATLYAGNGYGSFFVPEVGDEVIVAFIHGDMRLPIVLGGVHNGKDKPSTHRDSDRDQKLIRTKGGHEILLDDTSTAKAVKITTNGGHAAVLDDQGHSVSLTSSGGHKVVLDDQGKSVSVESAGGQSVKIDASGAVTVTGTMITLDATGLVRLGGAGAAQSLVLGETLLALFNSHVHTTALPGLPTSPPVPPLTPAVLSTKVKTS